MLFLLILYCLGSMIIVLIFDFIAEYFLFMKDMKMDKQEVKRNTRSKKEIQKLSLNAESASGNSFWQPVQDEQLSSEDKFIEGEDTKIENKDDNLKN